MDTLLEGSCSLLVDDHPIANIGSGIDLNDETRHAARREHQVVATARNRRADQESAPAGPLGVAALAIVFLVEGCLVV